MFFSQQKSVLLSAPVCTKNFLDQKNSNLLLINILDNNIQIKESFVSYGDEKVDVTDKIIKMRE